jgi:hypothetical protein
MMWQFSTIKLLYKLAAATQTVRKLTTPKPAGDSVTAGVTALATAGAASASCRFSASGSG